MNKDFKNLTSTFKNSIKTWDYFVNWEKVFSNFFEFEIILNKLNYLLGKKDLRVEFLNLYKDNPDITKALPILLALREKRVEIYEPIELHTEIYDFSSPRLHSAEEYFEFIEKSGLIRLFKEDGIKNLVDYVLGVEVGLDSNGRKNRGGKIMEEIVDLHIETLCKKNGFEYLKQANAQKVQKAWGQTIGVNKSSRSFDFVVYNPKSKKIKVIETNFYNDGGSKLKSVCGEFRTLYKELKKQKIDFIWITDGLGWKKTLRPLEETFGHNEYVFNLSMLENGILDKLSW